MIVRCAAALCARGSANAHRARNSRFELGETKRARLCHSSLSSPFENSPIQTIRIGTSHRVHVKRDDLLGEAGTGGNKARKLAGFRRLLSNSDPASSRFSTIISTGGCQSNAMLAIAYFAKEHGLEFHFFSPPVSKKARSEPQGNLASALRLGMHLHESKDIENDIKLFRSQQDMQRILDVPRGVSCEEAEEGLAKLAQELDDHFRSIRGEKTNSCIVVLPSGTGTTAMFLNKHLQILSSKDKPYLAKTVGVSIAMKQEDILKEIQAQYPNEKHGYPTFTHPSKKRIMFAKPDPTVKAVWCTMKRKGILLDLIYGPVAWMSLFELLPSVDPEACEVYYVHTGGITGNETQLHRYEEKACPAKTLRRTLEKSQYGLISTP